MIARRLAVRPSLQLVRPALQVAAAGGAALFAYRAFHLYRESNTQFDEAVLWLGLSIVCLAFAVWDGQLQRPAVSRSGALALLRRHRWELLALTAITAAGSVFRLYSFTEFPPSGVVFGEEAINGRVAYEILDGSRPLAHPLARYPAAFGFLIFGENTTGLRLPFIVASALTIVPFYLLARELVRPASALFVTALFAAAMLMVVHVQALQVRILFMVFFFFLFVGGIRRQSPFWLLGAGLLAGLLSYDWEAFKLVPFAAVGFLGALAAKALLWPWPGGLSALMQRAAGLTRHHWRSALAFFGGAGLVAIPLVGAQVAGRGVYLKAIDRHVSGSYEASTGLFSSNWPEKLKWAAEIFLPYGPRTFPSPPLSSGLPLVDFVSGTLLLLAVVFAVVSCFRPYRLLFLSYFLVGMAGAAILSEPFWGWRFVPLLPVGLILVAFLVDDASALTERHWPMFARYAIPGLLVAASVYAFVANANMVFSTVVDDPDLPRVYSGDRPERGFALCDYMGSQGDDNFSYIIANNSFIGAFSRTHETVLAQTRAFGDLAWVCAGLSGIAVPATHEAWPLYPVPDGPATIVLLGAPGGVESVAAIMRQPYTGKATPDHVSVNPATEFGPFAVIGYEFTEDEVRAMQGLRARYEAPDGSLLEERVDNVADMRWSDADVPAPPFTVRWSGIVYLDSPATASLVTVGDAPAEVRVGGQLTYSSLDGQPALYPQELLPGWHPVEITASKRTADGTLSLRWLDAQGGLLTKLPAEQLFPLPTLDGWRHRRTMTSEEYPLARPTIQRFDFEPHFALQEPARVRAVVLDEPPKPGVQQVSVAREEWSAYWEVPEARQFLFQTEVRSGSLVVTLDGKPIFDLPPQEAERTAEVLLQVPAGEHRIEIVQTPGGGLWTGATFTINDPNDPTFSPSLSPFSR